MKASFITESILYCLARGLSLVAVRLTPSLNTALGARMGDVAYRLLPKRRLAALKNLRAAFGSEVAPAQYQKIIRSLFQNLGMTLMEVARIPKIDRAYVERWITMTPDSRERIETALSQGHGVVLIQGHFGNWELVSITGALLGYPAVVLAREQGWPRLNRLITQYRESKGCRVVTKGFPIRELIRSLREGRIVGIVSDQDGGKSGVLAPFMGRLASTAPGAIALGLETGAPILPLFMVRTKGPGHTLLVGEPIQVSPGRPIQEQIREGLTQYLQALEQMIRQHPEQWLWLHRRWKSSPQRRLLIFSDGKAGHLNQALALSKRIESVWNSKAAQDRRLAHTAQNLVQVKTVDVSFRNPLWRLAISLAASFAPRRFRGGDFWLRRGLTLSCYEALRSEYADLSISCGASTAAVHLMWAWGIGARSVHITRSVLPSWRRFDLAVIPRHDRPPSAGKNLLVTDGALAPQWKADPAQVNHWKNRLRIERPRQIGLLLGGPTRWIDFDSHQIKRLILSLLESCETLDAELLVTSSRRTPASLEAALFDLLKKHPRCRLLVLVGRSDSGGLQSFSEAVGCIMELSQALIVSGDSISMISEAVSTRKPVIGFVPRMDGRRPLRSKYHRFLSDMESQRNLAWVEPERVGEAVMAAFEKGTVPQGDSPFFSPVEEYLKKWL